MKNESIRIEANTTKLDNSNLIDVCTFFRKQI